MIVGLFHPGATVSNLKNSLAFYGETLGITDIKNQFSDQPYLAEVTGLPGAKLNIGFLRLSDDGFPLELIDPVNDNCKEAPLLIVVPPSTDPKAVGF